MSRILVIGGSSGIGRAIAEAAVKRGWPVMTMQRGEGPPGMLTQPLDLRSSPEEVSDAVELAAKIFSPTHFCIAGGVGAYSQPLLDLEQLRELVATNYEGPVAAARGLLAWWFRERSRFKSSHLPMGPPLRIAYVGSSSERNPARELEVYSSVKAAGSAYFKKLGVRFARKGVRSNVLEVGWSLTPMIADIEPERLKRIERAIPVEYIADPADVAADALALLTASDNVTGCTWQTTGGL